MQIIDLGIAIADNLPSDPPPTRPHIEYLNHKKGTEELIEFTGVVKDDLPNGLAWATENLRLCTHSGTHMDAPWHYHPTMNNGEPSRTIDLLPLEWCLADGVVVDFHDKPAEYVVSAKDFEDAFFKLNYKIKPLDIVLIRTDADKFWGKEDYLEKGCGIGREATLWLIDQGVKIAGIDSWGWDRPLSIMAREYQEHKDPRIIWEGHYAGIEKEFYHMEKMTNLDKLPATGFKIACFPVKIKSASAGWVRPVALVP